MARVSSKCNRTQNYEPPYNPVCETNVQGMNINDSEYLVDNESLTQTHKSQSYTTRSQRLNQHLHEAPDGMRDDHYDRSQRESSKTIHERPQRGLVHSTISLPKTN